MGWASGSSLMSEVIRSMKAEVDSKPRRRVYKILIPAFAGMDCDTLDECRGEDPVYDAELDEWLKECG